MAAAKQPLEKPIYQLKVTLMGSKPPIWRRVQVAGDIILDKLHEKENMMSTEEVQSAKGSPIDEIFQLFVGAVNESGEPVLVTCLIGGVVMCCSLVSWREYVETLVGGMEQAGGKEVTLSKTFLRRAELHEGYVHLKDIRVLDFSGGVCTTVQSHGTWRVHMDAIQGWALGAPQVE